MIGSAFNKMPAVFDLTRQERQAGAAAYMILPGMIGDNDADCKQSVNASPTL